MPALDQRVRAISCKMASRKRWDPNADLSDLRRELALARVEAKIAAAVETAPPLPPDVENRLVEIIRSHRPTVDAALARAASTQEAA